jgi:hypothetical protein
MLPQDTKGQNYMSTSKRKKRIDDPRQLTIYDQIAQVGAARKNDAGSMCVLDELKGSLNLALKRCPLSRHQVAGQMSHLLNEEISKAMIDSWTCESKTDRHIPAEYIPAFCAATGSNDPLQVLNRKIGLFTMLGKEALRSEIHELREESRDLQAEIRKREQLLELYKVNPSTEQGGRS